MPRSIDTIEIVEPPIGELTKRHSSFKGACLAGCSGIIIFIVGIVVVIRLLIGSGPETFKTVPSTFPDTIPVYDKDAIEHITFIPGKYKNRSLEIAALFPKIILSPLLIRTDDTAPSTTGKSFTQALWHIITTPVSDERDSIQIEWKNLDAEPSFIIAYYKKELKKKGYSIDDESIGKNNEQFSFSQKDVSGSLSVESAKKSGTDYALLVVNLPSKK